MTKSDKRHVVFIEHQPQVNTALATATAGEQG